MKCNQCNGSGVIEVVVNSAPLRGSCSGGEYIYKTAVCGECKGSGKGK